MTSESTKPKRRWLQFSLRTFLILLTVFAVWLGWWMNGLREQRKAVEMVREFGSKVSFHIHLGDGYDVRYVNLPDTAVSDLTPFSRCKNLEKLNLNDTQVQDLTPLKGLTKLELLWLEDTQVKDVTPLADMENLQSLDIRGTDVSDRPKR